jgi:hypothetical protein
MQRNCPPFLLTDELEIMRPAFILALGGEPRNAVDRVDGYVSTRAAPSACTTGAPPTRLERHSDLP